ncbi:MAG TPA: hypothetical protein VJ946_00625, partial [Bacteroidales bacterium]|nr:hypothetical protein [Bacteroidales bacterium]
LMYYEVIVDNAPVLTPVPIKRVEKIIELNKEGIEAEALIDEQSDSKVTKEKNIDYASNLNQDSINRFENKKKKPKGKNKNFNKKRRDKNKRAPQNKQNPNKPHPKEKKNVRK